MRPTIDDLARLAALNGVVIPREDLERLLPPVAGFYQDLDRLRALPVDGVEPVFTPEPRSAEAPKALDGPEAAAAPDTPDGPDARRAERRDL